MRAGPISPMGAGFRPECESGQLMRHVLFARLGEECFFATTDEATTSYLDSHPVEWVDHWEDRKHQGTKELRD